MRTVMTPAFIQLHHVFAFVLGAFINIISFNPHNILVGRYCYYCHSTDKKLKVRSLNDIQGHVTPK